jgi:hypothetical protein
MRVAVFRAQKNRQTAEGFARQQAFDSAIATLVRGIPVPPEAAEWFINEKLVATGKGRTWKKTARHPAMVAIGLAVLVILGICVHIFLQRLDEFPGSSTARKLLTVASSTRASQLEPVQADAGELSDLFFMKYRLEHYDVPPEFAYLRTVGSRVFNDEEGHQVAQIEVAEKRMQFFLFPAEQQQDGRGNKFTGWRSIDQEGWVAVVQQRNGVCFMAALRGSKKDLMSYLKTKS